MNTILCIGFIRDNEINYLLAPAPERDEPQDGELQEIIDYGAELQDLLDAREDEEWIRGGCQ